MKLGQAPITPNSQHAGTVKSVEISQNELQSNKNETPIIPIDKSENKSETKQPIEKVSINTIKGHAGKKKVGGLSNIDDLLANVQKEEQYRKENSLDWNVNSISKIWRSYMDTLDTQSTIIALGSTKLSVEGETIIKIVTPNKLNTETIKKEMALIEKIRNSFPERDLEIKIQDDLSQFPDLATTEKVKKVKSNEEKLEILVEKNPSISDFIKRFDLKVDK